MTDFQKLRNIEKVEMLFNAAKALAVSFGATEESFVEAESNFKEIKSEFLKRVSGGIVANSAQNGQVDGAEQLFKIEANRLRRKAPTTGNDS